MKTKKFIRINSFFKTGSGYTLIEILVAVVIFLIVMVAGLAFFSYGRIDINLSGHFRQAKELAEQKLEELKKSSWDNIMAIKDEEEGLTEEGITVGNMSFDRITAVTDPEDEDLDDFMQEVEVKVIWTEKGATQEVRLETIIAR